MGSLVSMVSVLIILFLDAYILYSLSVPMYGLRFVPVYGDYYFYQNLIPDCKKFSIAHIVISCIYGVVVIVAVVTMFFVYLGDAAESTVYAMMDDFGIAGHHGAVTISETDAFLFSILIVLLIVLFIMGLVDFVIRLVLNMHLSVAFGMNKYLGIVFTLFTLVGRVCYLVNSEKYVGLDEGYYVSG